MISVLILMVVGVPTYSPVGVPLRPLPGLIVDQDRALATGQWRSEKTLDGYVGQDYRVSSDPDASIEYLIQAPQSGQFELRMIYAADESFGHSVPVTVLRRGIEVRRLISQRKEPTEGYFKLIGKYSLDRGETIRVKVESKKAGGRVYADAFQLLTIPGTQPTD